MQLPAAWLPPSGLGAARGRDGASLTAESLALITGPGTEPGAALMCVKEMNVFRFIYLIH